MNMRIVILLGLLHVSAALPAADDPVSMSGKELYARYCTACHGETGRGDGPVSASLKAEAPDISLIAQRHGGTFPRDLVERIIDGRHVLAGHGTREMPFWGEELSRARLGDPDAEAATRLMTARLADYVALLQRPAAGQNPTPQR
ncbi:MAG: c-type cytochrome [Povalibacter sp.]